jgi:hypothetical protein
LFLSVSTTNCLLLLNPRAIGCFQFSCSGTEYPQNRRKPRFRLLFQS